MLDLNGRWPGGRLVRDGRAGGGESGYCGCGWCWLALGRSAFSNGAGEVEAPRIALIGMLGRCRCKYRVEGRELGAGVGECWCGRVEVAADNDRGIGMREQLRSRQ